MKSKVLYALLSLVISFGLWVYVVTVEAPESEETYYNIPVVLDGQGMLDERNLMVISDREILVNLTLAGYRTDLDKLDNSSITLIADLSQIREPGLHKLNYTVSYPSSNQNGAIHTVQKDPQEIEVLVVERARKDVPVKVVYTGTLPSGYTADRQNVTLDHATVTISGPKDVVDQIAEARIAIDLDGQTETIVETFRHTLCNEKGDPVADVSDITANVSDVKATVIIRKLKDIPLRLEVIPGGGVSMEMAGISMDRDMITVSGSEAALKDLDELVIGSIDLGKLTGSTELSFEIILPEGITNVTGVTTVTVTVELPEMETRSYTVKQFRGINTPRGARIKFLTEQVVVEIRGPVELLDQLRPEDIEAVVDFTEAQAGTAVYEAEIRIRGLDGVGAVGNVVTVNAEVELPEEA